MNIQWNRHKQCVFCLSESDFYYWNQKFSYENIENYNCVSIFFVCFFFSFGEKAHNWCSSNNWYSLLATDNWWLHCHCNQFLQNSMKNKKNEHKKDSLQCDCLRMIRCKEDWTESSMRIELLLSKIGSINVYGLSGLVRLIYFGEKNNTININHLCIY